jgi:hypothetical protein
MTTLALDNTLQNRMNTHIVDMRQTVTMLMSRMSIDYATREALFQPDPVKTIQYIERLMFPRHNGAVQSGLIRLWNAMGGPGVRKHSLEAAVIANAEFYSPSAIIEAARRVEHYGGTR